MNREVQVRICERLGVKFPGPTRQEAKSLSILSMSPIHRKRTGQHDWHVSFPNRWIDSLVDTIFYISTFLAWPVVPSVVKFLGPGLLCFWHRLD